MMKLGSFLSSVGALGTWLLLGLLGGPSGARADLPKEGFPLGREDLPEVRTVKELRPGLTHVHVERGAWGAGGPPKVALKSGPTRDRASLAETRACLERAGYIVREQKFQGKPTWPPYYILFAGEFDTMEEARQAALRGPCPVQVGTPVFLPTWDTGPWTIDIVIVDPKVYRGKVISAWSGKALRESPLALARKRNAVVVTNGSFFEYSEDEIAGVPSGISIVDGVWHHEPQPPDHHAPMLFLDNDPEKGTSLSIGSSDDAPPFPEFKWTGPSGKKSIKLDGLDRMPKDNELIAMGPLVADTSPLSHYIPDYMTLRQIGDDGYLAFGYYRQTSGAVLIATGDKRKILDEAMASKQPVELDLSVANRPGLNAWYVTPVLIKNGEPIDFSDRDVYYLDFHTRTAIGADAEGKIYLISVDGTSIDRIVSKEGRFGVTLAQLQDIAQFLGLVNAGNLDGGLHSTSMVIEGKVMGQDAEWHMETPYDDDREVGDMVMVTDEGD